MLKSTTSKPGYLMFDATLLILTEERSWLLKTTVLELSSRSCCVLVIRFSTTAKYLVVPKSSRMTWICDTTAEFSGRVKVC